MKKVYAVAEVVPERVTYFTAGKKYEATQVQGSPWAYYVNNDRGRQNVICPRDCAHLDGGKWTITEEGA